MAIIKPGFAVPGRRVNDLRTLSSKKPIALVTLVVLAILASLLFNKSSLHSNRTFFLRSSSPWSSHPSVVIAPENRGQIASILEFNNLTVGAELGVQVRRNLFDPHNMALEAVILGFLLFAQDCRGGRRRQRHNYFYYFIFSLSPHLYRMEISLYKLYVNGIHAKSTI